MFEKAVGFVKANQETIKKGLLVIGGVVGVKLIATAIMKAIDKSEEAAEGEEEYYTEETEETEE